MHKFIYIPLIVLIALMLRRLCVKNMSTYISGTHSIAYVTVPSQDVAKNIAKNLVKVRLIC